MTRACNLAAVPALAGRTSAAVPALTLAAPSSASSAAGPRTRRAAVPILVLVLALVPAGCGTSDEPGEAPATITTATGVRMVLIPAGEFVMGDEEGDDDARPAHRVGLGAFYIDATEVTQRHYETLMGRNPSKFTDPDRPVERASWLAAAKYCNMRSLREGLRPCYDPATLACDFSADGYRLPTEAEWEYACRAATAGRYGFGADPRGLDRHAWFKANAEKGTHPVGRKRPNAWGLFDMHGNVAEWCNDFYGESYYTERVGADPRGPASSEERVLRGGSWRSGAEACRSSARFAEAPGLADVCFGYEAYGFRCVRRAPADSAPAQAPAAP